MAVTLYNTITKPSGLAQDDFEISIDLRWDKSVSPVAYLVDSEAMLKGAHTASTNVNGRWQAELVDNDSITPAGSVYKITEVEIGGALVNEYFVSIPGSASGEVWVGSLIVGTPAWGDD
jgi:hypothetical protein